MLKCFPKGNKYGFGRWCNYKLSGKKTAEITHFEAKKQERTAKIIRSFRKKKKGTNNVFKAKEQHET